MYRIATNEAITFMQQRAKKQGISNEEAQQKAINKLESDVFLMEMKSNWNYKKPLLFYLKYNK